jgi:hypothetical protein
MKKQESSSSSSSSSSFSSSSSKNADERNSTNRPSAFRAVNVSDNQKVKANKAVDLVKYPVEQFDLNKEYCPNESTFTPKHDGIYLIIASVTFLPKNPNESYRLVLNIRVDDIPVVTDDEFFGPNPVGTGDQVSVSSILKLKKGHPVTISLFSTTNGTIFGFPRGTHFEAARFTF